jgi:hypothetical protein
MKKQYMVKRWESYRVDAFWARVKKSDGCWEWTGLTYKSPKNSTPYGVLGWCGKTNRSHRVAYELTKGPIPEGMMVLHTCDNTLCCNPEHLYAGTQADNMRDVRERGRRKGIGLGANNGRAKVTQAQAEAIRVVYAAGGVSQQQIGKLYEISQFAVSSIIRNKRYV